MGAYGPFSDFTIDILRPSVSLGIVTKDETPVKSEAPSSSTPHDTQDLTALATLLAGFFAGIPEQAVAPARRLAATLCGDWSTGNRIASRAIGDVVLDALVHPDSLPKTSSPRVLFVTRVFTLMAESEHPSFDVGADIFAFSTRVTTDERIDAIKALNGIDSDRQRLVVYMSFLLGMTDVEIAQSLEISRGAVRKLASRGMRALLDRGMLGTSNTSFPPARP